MLPTAFRSTSFVLLLTQLTFFVPAQRPVDGAAPSAAILEAGKPVERQLKGGESHLYSFNVVDGQFAGITVDQRGIDVVVLLYAPDGKKLAEVDSPNGTKGPEPVSLVARTSGGYRIEIRSLEKASAEGRYEVKIAALRVATIQDKADDLSVRLLAAKSADERAALMAEHNLPPNELLKALGNLFIRAYNQSDFSSATNALLIAQQIAEQMGDKPQVAKVLLNLGSVYHVQKKYQQALEYYQKSLAVSEESKDSQGIAKALNNIGLLYYGQQNYHKAIESYHKSLAVSETAGLKPIIAQTAYSLGTAYQEQGEFVRSLEYLQKSLALNEALGDKRVVNAALQAIGNTYQSQGNYSLALEFFQRSLVLTEEFGDKQGAARIFNGIASVYTMQGDYQMALDYFQRSLSIREAIGDKEGASSTTGNMGAVRYLQSDYALAVELHQRALLQAETLGIKRFVIAEHINLGLAYEAQSDYKRAIEHYQKALGLSQEGGDKANMAKVLNSISGIFATQGNYEQSLEYQQKALAINEQIENKEGVAAALSRIGSGYDAQGKFDKALEHYQKSLALSEAIGNKLGAASSMESIGGIYHARRNYARAMEIYRKALSQYEALGSKSSIAETLTSIALVHLEQGEYEKALDHSQRSADLAKQISSPELFWKAKTTLGKSYSALKQHGKAIDALDDALTTIEFIRSNFSGREARTSYFSTVLEPYQLYIDLLMQQQKQHPSGDQAALALQMNERARARSLLEALSEARSDIRQGVDPQLLQREKSLQQQLNARAERYTRLLSEKHTPDQAAILKKEIDALTVEYQNIQARIKHSSPRYAALMQPEPLNMREIQQEVLDHATILLQYWLGEKQSYLWAVTKDSIKSYELPPRAVIEAAVRSVYTVVSDGKLVTDSRAHAEYEREAARLSEMLLAPVAAQIQKRRIVIVADGALQYLPFSTLPSPISKVPGPKSKMKQPLIIENEIVSLPSASTLASLRRQVRGRALASKTVAVLADPVFSPTDERVKTTNAATQPTPLVQEAKLERTARDLGVLRDGIIQRLPFSRREAESILTAVPSGEKKQALDFEASRATALGSEMSQYRIIHFATHGLLHTEHPELSGMVLSLVNEQGKPVDGFLRLNEIYNMNLNADLVVLSACQTALGKEVKGEGLIGLTRGFMYAGSPRVVASLWKVDDVATAELMTVFYQKMLQEKMRPAAALRAAKVEMWKTKRWNAPFYWAAFELQGEWR